MLRSTMFKKFAGAFVISSALSGSAIASPGLCSAMCISSYCVDSFCAEPYVFMSQAIGGDIQQAFSKLKNSCKSVRQSQSATYERQLATGVQHKIQNGKLHLIAAEVDNPTQVCLEIPVSQ